MIVNMYEDEHKTLSQRVWPFLGITLICLGLIGVTMVLGWHQIIIRASLLTGLVSLFSGVIVLSGPLLEE